MLVAGSAALAAALPAIGAAQRFEGTVDVRITAAGPNGTTGVGGMTFDIKGDRTLVLTHMFGQEVHVLNDFGIGMRTVWMPVPPGVPVPPTVQAQGGTKGLKFEQPIAPRSAGGRDSTARPSRTLRKLGTSETIAGIRCDDYEIESTNPGGATRVCLTTALGQFSYPGSPSAPGSPSTTPEWSGALGDRPAFPLRVWTADGRNQWQVIRVQRHTIPDSVFAVPSGYLDMAKLRGGGTDVP
jgi:Domain of unknown function (DUF4412)